MCLSTYTTAYVNALLAALTGSKDTLQEEDDFSVQPESYGLSEAFLASHQTQAKTVVASPVQAVLEFDKELFLEEVGGICFQKI